MSRKTKEIPEMASRSKRNGNRRKNRVRSRNRGWKGYKSSPNRYQKGLDEIKSVMKSNFSDFRDLVGSAGCSTGGDYTAGEDVIRHLISIERKLDGRMEDAAAGAVRERVLKVAETVERAYPLLEAIGSDPETDRKIARNTALMLRNSLRRMGVESRGCAVGDMYDPSMMEAVSLVDTDDESLEDRVAEVVSSAAYWLDGELIMPQAVSVYRRCQRCPRTSRPL